MFLYPRPVLSNGDLWTFRMYSRIVELLSNLIFVLNWATFLSNYFLRKTISSSLSCQISSISLSLVSKISSILFASSNCLFRPIVSVPLFGSWNSPFDFLNYSLRESFFFLSFSSSLRAQISSPSRLTYPSSSRSSCFEVSLEN
jgi:hypothetical protein